MHRDQIESIASANFIYAADVLEVELSIREAAKSETPRGGQRFFKCQCVWKCKILFVDAVRMETSVIRAAILASCA